MGHREALLEGAKQCLTEKGYARTRARDIVAASGANLASIGYHYGSVEALLNEALIQANAEWGEALEKAMVYRPDSGRAPHEQFEEIWNQVIELFSGQRRLWLANFEAFTQIGHSPQLRAALAKGLREARTGLGENLLARSARHEAHRHETDRQEEDRQEEERRDEERAAVRAVGAFYQALLTGVMAQWLIDPDSAPTGQDLARALHAITAGLPSSQQEQPDQQEQQAP